MTKVHFAVAIAAFFISSELSANNGADKNAVVFDVSRTQLLTVGLSNSNVRLRSEPPYHFLVSYKRSWSRMRALQLGIGLSYGNAHISFIRPDSESSVNTSNTEVYLYSAFRQYFSNRENRFFILESFSIGNNWSSPFYDENTKTREQILRFGFYIGAERRITGRFSIEGKVGVTLDYGYGKSTETQYREETQNLYTARIGTGGFSLTYYW